MSKLLLPRGFRNAEQLLRKLHSEPEQSWIRRGEKRALKLFHGMAMEVPAYKDFLQKQHFDPKIVESASDFRKIPPIDKDNYLRVYPKDLLCWEGNYPNGQWVISTTSGSTGSPYYFPREQSQDWQYAIMAELYLRSNFKIQNHKTLYVVAFPMGAWIGGLFTYEALKILAANQGYDLSIITPGIHKQEVINAVKELGENYDKIIIGAYAPFLKDILDDGKREGVDWSKYNLGFVFSAEAFTETFRDYVVSAAKLKDVYRDTLNHYGTVDLGTMSHETPETVMIRRSLVTDNNLSVFLPEQKRQPTITQYIPELYYFESDNNNLFCSAFSGIPLFRYDLKDYGGVISRREVFSKMQTAGYDLEKIIDLAGIKQTTWNLPYVYVYERNDFSVSYYAFLIYPDMIRRSIQVKDLTSLITGKFTMIVDYAKGGRQRLNVHLEMKGGTKKTKLLEGQIKEIIHERLLEESSEYRETANTIGADVKPDVHLHSYEDHHFFKPGGKQKWVQKNQK